MTKWQTNEEKKNWKIANIWLWYQFIMESIGSGLAQYFTCDYNLYNYEFRNIMCSVVQCSHTNEKKKKSRKKEVEKNSNSLSTNEAKKSKSKWLWRTLKCIVNANKFEFFFSNCRKNIMRTMKSNFFSSQKRKKKIDSKS